MDVQRPIPRQRLSADWGRAVADAIAAGRLSGDGVLRTPVGTSTAPVQPPPVSVPPPPGECFAAWVASDGEGGHVLRVRKGALRDPSRGGAELEYSASDFTDGGEWWEAMLPAGGATVAAIADGEGGWTLRLLASGATASGDAWPVADVGAADGHATKVRQLRTGDISIGSSGIHYGDAEGAEKADSWSIADGTPAILDIGRAKVLIDSRGNVISWNAASGGGGGEDEPDDPEAPSAPPPCGNPLNATDDDDPLLGHGGGGSGGTTDNDYNPLDYEGPGGFTPTCGGNAA